MLMMGTAAWGPPALQGRGNAANFRAPDGLGARMDGETRMSAGGARGRSGGSRATRALTCGLVAAGATGLSATLFFRSPRAGGPAPTRASSS